ncbi:hypothetical protein PI124_g22826 [Phytophthora idaei]|nr:hypothetical protein PI125_g24750 [Phytophthora idaei]KAG3125405.1 hypothetical protein PI126_g22780 [Phytophthora idaei]KAG3232085.1 hypothetical protein PI124_g22826 [Phytophthora idaei]
MLKVALSNGRTYASDVTVFMCALEVESVEVQNTMGENANDPHKNDFKSQSGTDYSFRVYGCPVGAKEDVGFFPEKVGCSDAGWYRVVVYSQPKNDIVKVTAISRNTENDD